MHFAPSLIPAVIERRYKRFLADVTLPTGEILTVHCPNSGSMKGCWEPGWPAMISDSRSETRKYPYGLEMTNNGVCWIGINTHLANKLALEALTQQAIPGLPAFDEIRTEVKYGTNSRVDLLGMEGDKLTYIEVKNVTLIDELGRFSFPDSVTVRGLKHLHELRQVRREGHRAVMLFVIQRSDGEGFAPAWDLDPDYAEGLAEAVADGVEVFPCPASVDPEGIKLTGTVIPCDLSRPDATPQCQANGLPGCVAGGGGFFSPRH